MTHDLHGLGRALLVAGALLVAAGLVVMAGVRLPWLGRLPGDIRIERNGVSLFFPLTSCLVVSGAVSLIAWVLRRFR